MARKIEEPVETPVKGAGNLDEIEITHPAFAQIGITRISGHTALYGSDFRHQYYIRLHITPSKLTRRLSSDWPHGSLDSYVEVDMSEAQWATLVSSLNVGLGVQCTLTKFGKEMIPGLPDPKSRSEQFTKELAETRREAMAALEDVLKEAASMGLSKTKLEALTKKVQRAAMSIGSSTKFVATQWGEYIEKTKEDAKAEINAYALRAMSGQKTNLEILPEKGYKTITLKGKK